MGDKFSIRLKFEKCKPGGSEAIGSNGADGVLKSRAFPGLWLDSHAAIALDMDRVLQIRARGLASPGHRRFNQ